MESLTYLTTKEAAEYVRESVPGLHRSIFSGKGPRCLTGKGTPRRFRKEWLDEWIDFKARNPDWALWQEFLDAWKNRRVENFHEFFSTRNSCCAKLSSLSA